MGTGFSFTDSKAGYPNYVNESSEDLFHALQQFFQMFHEYKDRCVLWISFYDNGFPLPTCSIQLGSGWLENYLLS